MTATSEIIVLGGTGMLGHKLFQILQASFPDTVTVIRKRRRDNPYHNIPLFQSANVIDAIDVLAFEKLAEVLRDRRPQFVINCIGIIKQRDEASSRVSMIALNALLPHRLADLCTSWGGRLIHISTDCVFSGQRGMYTEEDVSDADDLYGRTKYLGEVSTQNALTLRTSIIGRELTTHRSLLDWFLSNNGKRVSGYRKSIYSGVTTNQLAQVVTHIVSNHPNLSGIYQVASEPIAKSDLLILLRDAFGCNIEIDQIDGEDVDRSMSGSKLREATGYVCPPWPVLARQLAEDPTPYDIWLRC